MEEHNNDNDRQEHVTAEILSLGQKQKKRERSLANWKWDEVIDTQSSKAQQLADEELDTTDTADSLTSFKIRRKIPRVYIKNRNRIFKVFDEPDDDDLLLLGEQNFGFVESPTGVPPEVGIDVAAQQPQELQLDPGLSDPLSADDDAVVKS